MMKMCSKNTKSIKEEIEEVISRIHTILISELRREYSDISDDITFYQMYLISDPKSVVNSISGDLITVLEDYTEDLRKLEALRRIYETCRHLLEFLPRLVKND